MIIIVDKNEEDVAPEIIKSLERHFSNVIIANLPHREYGGISVTAGDINIPLNDGSILAIERKAAGDFIQSIPDRHIFNQVEVMAQNSKYCAVIVTGKISYGMKNDLTFADERQTGMPGVSVRNAIAAIQFSGCPVMFCPVDQYCNTIAELYTLVNKPEKHQGIVKNRIIKFPPVDERINLMAQFPSLGLTLATNLMKAAYRPMIDSDPDEIGTVAYALELATKMSMIDKDLRPAGWGAKKIFSFRQMLGLAGDEYLKIERTIEEDHKKGAKTK